METIHVSAGIGATPAPGKSVVLVPYYSAVEKECDEGLRALGQAGVQVRRASFSAIDLLRCVMLSQALHDGFDSFLFIDSDIGFNAPDALRLLSRPEPVVAGIYMKKNSRDYSAHSPRGSTGSSSAPPRRASIRCSTHRPASCGFVPRSSIG